MASEAEIYDVVRGCLLAFRDAETGVWTGCLSSSALGTALAVAALINGPPADRTLAVRGVVWLVRHAGTDGGWGDTPESVSNLSATLIALGALRRARMSGVLPDEVSSETDRAIGRAEVWVVDRAGALSPAALARELRRVYGNDRTFSVPILAFLAMCGGGGDAWLSVPSLPFLLALLPQGFYRFFRLQVVSYALPALIAVGLCRHVCVARVCRCPAWGRLFSGLLLRRLAALQPAHGGFLDAVPLTAFVSLSLDRAGYGDHPVARLGLAFLRSLAREDGSWAIDSSLRTWVTSLATRALLVGGGDGRGFSGAHAVAVWLVRTQTRARHPFTGARAGGWAWTDQSGGVPDADDTAGALVALRRLETAGVISDAEVRQSAVCGLRWLMGVQNADGGIPTFCRGWGRLPFDRSCPDISAHVIEAFCAWMPALPHAVADGGGGSAGQVARAMRRVLAYLKQAQAPDGSWTPLWFGHQASENGRNPVIGTSRVVAALRHLAPDDGFSDAAADALGRGTAWLLRAQRPDGGWSMGPVATVEETALAVIALSNGDGACWAAAERGRKWLVAQGSDGLGRASPLGLYFSLLWYHEQLYPLVWALQALGMNQKGCADG